MIHNEQPERITMCMLLDKYQKFGTVSIPQRATLMWALYNIHSRT